MSEMLDVMGFAALSSQVLVTEMVKSGWSSTREIIARIFRRGGENSEVRQLELLDRDCERLLSAADDDVRAEISKDVQGRWALLLAALLEQFPDAREDLQEILEQADQKLDQEAAAASLRALHNVNSQIVQAGGSISTGGGSISYGKLGRKG